LHSGAKSVNSSESPEKGSSPAKRMAMTSRTAANLSDVGSVPSGKAGKSILKGPGEKKGGSIG
jgi:hypothetical protein